MRLALTLLCALLAPITAARAAEEFNPYQASIDRMPIADAMRQIEAHYGPTKEPRTYENGTVTVMGGTDHDLSLFLFCDGKMAGMSASVSTEVAAKILLPLTGPDAKVEVFGTDDGVMLSLLGHTLTFYYRGIGTKSSNVIATYPTEVFNVFQFERYCDELKS
ncbi:hypothetical protein [Devosia sp.]|uniref:hypothetical protein n=1 Tax=Devosia sp. TaxID=1871048 RepID=UPI003267C9F3